MIPTSLRVLRGKDDWRVGGAIHAQRAEDLELVVSTEADRDVGLDREAHHQHVAVNTVGGAAGRPGLAGDNAANSGATARTLGASRQRCR